MTAQEYGIGVEDYNDQGVLISAQEDRVGIEDNNG